MSAVTSKVRLYDLAKDLKIDTKRLIEEVRREGVDVSVPSNYISKELAEKIRDKYFPKKDTAVRRAVRLVKKAARPVVEEPPAEEEPEVVAPIPPAERELVPEEEPIAAPQPPPARVVRRLAPAVHAVKPAPAAEPVPVELATPVTAAEPVRVRTEVPVAPPTSRQVRVLRPTAAALNAGIRPAERTPASPPTESTPFVRPVRSKVRLFDLAKDLKIDTKRLIEEVRREGVDVSVPSNSISQELAHKIRDKYFPKKDTTVKRSIKVVKKPARPEDEVIAEQTDLHPSAPASEFGEGVKNNLSEEDLLPLTIDGKDEILIMVRDLIGDYAGVILTGPPGTSKTWYARQIASALTNRDGKRVRFVQFHQSYQYEDFVEGYVPREDGNGFQLRPKHLLEMCEVARKHDDKTCVIIIDELSRSDPGRIFGEALTYIEPTQREVEFYLASGNPAKIPRNLFFLATMNPEDRGVDEVDAALDRRFAKIAMDPIVERLMALLDQNGLDEQLKNSVVRFFRFLLNNPNERSRVGHAYFRAVRTEADLRRLWDHQLRFHMAKAFKLDGESFRNIEREWNRAFPASREPR